MPFLMESGVLFWKSAWPPTFMCTANVKLLVPADFQCKFEYGPTYEKCRPFVFQICCSKRTPAVIDSERLKYILADWDPLFIIFGKRYDAEGHTIFKYELPYGQWRHMYIQFGMSARNTTTTFLSKIDFHIDAGAWWSFLLNVQGSCLAHRWSDYGGYWARFACEITVLQLRRWYPTISERYDSNQCFTFHAFLWCGLFQCFQADRSM